MVLSGSSILAVGIARVFFGDVRFETKLTLKNSTSNIPVR